MVAGPGRVGYALPTIGRPMFLRTQSYMSVAQDLDLQIRTSYIGCLVSRVHGNHDGSVTLAERHILVVNLAQPLSSR